MSFGQTQKFADATQLLLEVEVETLRALLLRLSAPLQHSDSTPSAQDAQTEEQRLRDALDLGEEDGALVLDVCRYILDEAAYYGLKPAVLEQRLTDASLAQEQAQVFAEVWEEEGPEIIKALRNRGIGTFPRLANSSWMMGVHLSSDALSKQKDPRIFLQLELQRGVPEVGRREETIQRVDVECTHQNLSTFFNALEQIQEQLDALN